MFGTSPNENGADVYSPDEVAEAAGVESARVMRAIATGEVIAYRGFIAQADAVRLIRVLTGAALPSSHDRTPALAAVEPSRRGLPALAASGLLHAVGLTVLLLLSAYGLLTANDTDETLLKEQKPVKLVFLTAIGPGGGGGGGGLKMRTPPPPAERKAPVKVVRRTSSPVPPARRPPPPPQRPPPIEREVPPPPPLRPPPLPPLVVEPPKPPPAIQAPVAPVAADPVDSPGLPVKAAPAPPSSGSGTGGGIGSGAGTGLGEGQGGGIGPGSGGGTGGGPFQPGSGIDPPVLVREVRPTYTEEARKRAIEGDVVLEIVVRRDGTVGNLRVVRSLGAGLEQKAIEAVRQWRFGPAKRQGTPVEVMVEVAVEFKLR